MKMWFNTSNSVQYARSISPKILLAILLAFSITNLSYAFDCHEARNKLKEHKSQKKAREESLERLRKTREDLENKLFKDKREYISVESGKEEQFTLALASAVCTMRDLVQIDSDLKEYHCPEFQRRFSDLWEEIENIEYQVTNTQNVIQDLSNKMNTAEQLIADNCATAPEVQWKGEGVWKGTWTNTALKRSGESRFTITPVSGTDQWQIHYTSWTTDDDTRPWTNGSGVTRTGPLTGDTIYVPVPDSDLDYQFTVISENSAEFMNHAKVNDKWITVVHALKRELSGP